MGETEGKWERKDPYYLEHTSGAKVCKAYVGGVALFTAWDARGNMRKVHQRSKDAKADAVRESEDG